MAQGDAWRDFLTNWPKAAHAPVTLLVPKDRLKPGYARSDEPLLFLTATGDLGIQPLEGPALDGLRQARSWQSGPHWILLGKDGRILDEGTDLPKGEYLRSRLEALGITPTWEALEQFLRFYPENGTALQRRLSIATGLARRRLFNLRDMGKVAAPKVSMETGFAAIEPARSSGPDLPAEWCSEVEDTLDRLNHLPDPWRLSDGMMFQFWLGLYGKAASQGVRAQLSKWSESLLEAWRHNPHSGSDWMQTWQDGGMGLGSLWMSCETAIRPDGMLPELPALTPSPGRFWPHSAFLMALPWSRPDGADGKEILAFLERLPTETRTAPIWHDSWSDWLQYRSFIAFRRTMALVSLGRWHDATLALQEVRQWSGKQWTEVAGSLSSLYSKSATPRSPGVADNPVQARSPDGFLEVLRLPPVETPQPDPAPEPLRFLIWGNPEWLMRWEGMRSTPPLAPWSTTELKRDSPGDADTARLAQAGFPATGWAVVQGDSNIVARGEVAPDVAILAMQLRSAAPSRIHQLDEFIARHPEHLDARRDRYALVKARMPQAALESRLTEDAAAALIPLDFGPDAPWISDVNGWRAQARKVVPELEIVMQRWPDKAGLWRAWVAWSAFLPKPHSVLGFANGLPVFGSREVWSNRLPAQVHRAVAKECRESRKFGPMADWFEGAWSQVASQEPEAAATQADEREKAIYEGYREALLALGRSSERADLDRAWTSRLPKAKEAPSF